MSAPASIVWPKGYKGLMEKMARALGINLGAAVSSGRIDANGIERLMRRCALCADESVCERWLAANPSVNATPSYCVNSRVLAELKPTDIVAGGEVAGAGASLTPAE